MKRLMPLIGATVVSLALTAPALADTGFNYHATFVEPYGGPTHSPFTCPVGMSCGSATISGLGHVAQETITFNDCGLGCHLRVLTFDDGSTLSIREVELDAFGAPGNAGSRGYIGFGLPGNPQSLDISQTILGGTGRLTGATGTGEGTVRVAGGGAVISASGTIDLP